MQKDHNIQWIKRLLILFLFVSLGCSTKFVIKSTPEKTTVFILDPESGEKKRLGVTPVEKGEEEMRDFLGELKPDALYEVVFEKEGYESKTLWTPVTASGAITTEMNVKLKKDDVKAKNLKKVSDVLDQIFLAQNFARTGQLDRAISEIDAVLREYPELARALSMKGAMYFAKKDFAESLKWYEKALAANPKNEQAIKMVGRVQKQLGVTPQRVPAGSKKK